MARGFTIGKSELERLLKSPLRYCTKDIADVFDVRTNTILRTCDHYGLPRPRSRSGATSDELVALWAKHGDIGTIAAALGVTNDAVSRRLRDLDPPGYKAATSACYGRRYSKAARARAVQMYRDGASLAVIREVVGVSAGRLRLWCKKAGLPPRPPRGTQRVSYETIMAVRKRLKTADATAEVLGISAATVHRAAACARGKHGRGGQGTAA